MAVIQGGGELLLTQVSTTLACFIPAVISLVVILLLGRTKMYRDEWCIEDSPIMNRDFAAADGEEEIPDMTLVQAFVPYFALSIITLVVLLVKPLNTVLGQFKFGFAFPETSTGYGYVNKAVDCFSPLAPFTHASMFLFVSAIIGLVYYKKHGWIGEGGTKRVFVKSVSMTMPSGIARNRTCYYVKDYGWYRTDSRACKRNRKCAGKSLHYFCTICRTSWNIYDRK